MKKSPVVASAPHGPEQKASGLQRKSREVRKLPTPTGKQQGCDRLRPKQADGSALDERIPGLLLDSLTTVQTAILSATERTPYRVLRQAIAISEAEKSELTTAAQAVAAKHPDFFCEHKDALEFALALTALTAMKFDHLLTAMDQSLTDEPNLSPAMARDEVSGQHICSAREALAIALVVLAPLAILALALLIPHLRRK